MIGLSYSLFGLGYTLAQFFGGYLSDRFGRKYLIVIPTWLFFILYMLMALSNSWVYVAAFYLLVSISSAFQSPSFTSIIAESVEEEKVGMGFAAFEFSIMLGIALGPFVGSSLVNMFGVRGLIIGSAFVSLVAAIIRQLGLIEPTKRQSKTLKNLFSKEIMYGSLLLVLLCFFVSPLQLMGLS